MPRPKKATENAHKSSGSETFRFNHGQWSTFEKKTFLLGMKKFGRGKWKEISTMLTTRSVIQIKSHGQKYSEKSPKGSHVGRKRSFAETSDRSESEDSDDSQEMGTVQIERDDDDDGMETMDDSSMVTRNRHDAHEDDDNGDGKFSHPADDDDDHDDEKFEPEVPVILNEPSNIPTRSSLLSPGTVVVEPRDMDVVGTRSKIWANHPGTSFYRTLVVRSIRSLMTDFEGSQVQMADRILRIIQQDRGGAFLLDKDGHLEVMRPAAARNKVMLALTRGRKIRDKNLSPSKSQPSMRLMKLDNAVSIPAASLKRCDSQSRDPSIFYRAKEGSTNIPNYTLLIISHMCNQSDPQEALMALDNPLLEHENESERQTRLHLRHRYVASLSVGITPRTFSRRLMDLWGGSIVEVDQIDAMPDEISPIVPTRVSSPVSLATRLSLAPSSVGRDPEYKEPHRCQSPHQPNSIYSFPGAGIAMEQSEHSRVIASPIPGKPKHISPSTSSVEDAHDLAGMRRAR